MSSSASNGSIPNDVFRTSSPATNADRSVFEILTLNNPKETSEKIANLHKTNYLITPPSYKANTGIDPSIKYMQYLPYPIPFQFTAAPNEMPPDIPAFGDLCALRAVTGTAIGAIAGLGMGVFLGAMSDMTPPVTVINGKEVPQAPLREQMRTTMRATGEKALYWSRNFAFISGIFQASDCLVEKYRGKHDVWNELISGCMAGGLLNAKSGPSSMAFGCAGFAAFSLAINKLGFGQH